MTINTITNELKVIKKGIFSEFSNSMEKVVERCRQGGLHVSQTRVHVGSWFVVLTRHN